MRHVTGAEKTAFPSPVPTQVISNGEYNPLPQTEQQRQVEGLIKEYAETYGRKQGLDRRRFLRSASGMAAAFLAFNKVFGPVWLVSEAEAADPDKANARANRALEAVHLRRPDALRARRLRQGRAARPRRVRGEELESRDARSEAGGVPLTLQRYKMQNYLKEIFLDSDTKIALLSGAPFDDPTWWLLSNAQIAAARNSVNATAGSRRMFGHFVFTPNYPGWMDEVERGIAELKPDTWKGYTVGDPLSPSAEGHRSGASTTRSWSTRSTSGS